MKLLSTLLVVFSLLANSFAYSVYLGGGPTTVVLSSSCGGTDWDNGDTEKFEDPSTMFCTAGWSFQGGSSVTNQITQSSETYVSGNYSVKFEQPGTYTDVWMQQTVSADADFSVRFYVKVSGVGGSASASVLRFFDVDDESSFIGGTWAGVEWRNSGGTPQIRAIGSAASSTMTANPNQWYRIEFRYQPSSVASGCSIQVFPLASTTAALNTTFTAGNSGSPLRLGFGYTTRSSDQWANTSVWMDNIKIDTSGTTPIGQDE